MAAIIARSLKAAEYRKRVIDDEFHLESSLVRDLLEADPGRLADLLDGQHPTITGETSANLETYATEIVASGFPGIRELPTRIRRAQLDSHLDRVVDRDIAELGSKVRNPLALERWMSAYGAATATTTTFVKIAAAAAASPEHHLADPAFAVALLGLDEDALLTGGDREGGAFRDGPFLGALFESSAALSIRVHAQRSEARLFHFRMHRGDHEVDLIVERRDGRCFGIEVKLSPIVTDDDVRHLVWLRERLGPELLDAVIITTGTHSYRRPDRIAVIPAALLGP